VTDHLDRPVRARLGAAARERIRRVTAGLQHEADALADGVLVPKHRRLAPAEHWHPEPEESPGEDGAPSTGEAVASPSPPQAAAPGTRQRRIGQRLAPTAPAATGEAEAPDPRAPQAAPHHRALWRLVRDRAWTASWLDRLLITIEVLATLGLVAAALASFNMVDRLQQDLARLSGAPPSLAAPTQLPTVTPTLQPTPEPSATPSPPEAELPGGRNAPTPVATPSAQPPSLVGARIIIPAIRVDAPIVEGDDWDTLKDGVGHHIGSGLPGQAGNLVLSAHNDVYGAIFKNLGDLQAGDLVLIDTPERTYRYQVTSIRIVTPKETSVMDPTREPTLTLITCYPPLVDTHRIVVRASFVK